MKLNKLFKGRFFSALMAAIKEGDDMNEAMLLSAKKQLSLATATGEFLERLLAKNGVTKPAGVGISDDLFREIGIKQTNSKLVTNIFLDVLEIFYGEDAVRANFLSTRPEGYVLADGMTLIIRADGNPTPLIVTFQAENFTNIANASAQEVAQVISRTAFNAGYTITASVSQDPETGLNYILLMSGTKGPSSSISVVGGSAQNVFKFPTASLAVTKTGTQFTTSFVGPYVRFTWSAGPSPSLQFVNPNDYVIINGSSILELNQGTFNVENVQDGPVGQAYFDILNPTFTPQGPITLSGVNGASGGGRIQVDTSILTLQRTSNVVAVQTSGQHGMSVGQKVSISGVDNTTFNGTYSITSVGPTSFTYNQSGVNTTSNSGTAQAFYAIGELGATRTTTVTLTTTNHNMYVGQQVTILGVRDSSFNGSFSIASVTSNTISYSQDYSNDIAFFTPTKQVIQKQARYASVYQVNAGEVVVFLPATTKIVKRSLIGSWHIHNSALDKDFPGSYIYDPTTGFPISKTSTVLTEEIFAGELKTVGFGLDTTDFPDEEGFLVFDYGTSNQEGPVKYLGRPSSGSILLDPSYKFQKTHEVGADITLLLDRKPYVPKVDGTDYQAYLTGTVVGRLEAEKLIEQLSAAGIFLNIIVVYPKGPGLHNVEYVYGGD